MQRRFSFLLGFVLAAVCGLVIGFTVSSRGAGNAQAVPDPDEQHKYLELARAEHDYKVDWQPLHSFTFDDAESLKALRVCEGEWQVVDGQLQAIGGKADDYRTILLAPCSAGPMRIEFDATLYPRPDGRVGDIYLRLNADDTCSSAKGYGLFVARYFNQDSVCYKNNQPIARTEWSPIVPGKQHHIIAEWNTVHLRLWVDGKVVIDAWDRTNPIAPDPAKWIGLAAYDTRLAVDNLVISGAKGK